MEYFLLGFASFIIAHLPVDEEDGKVRWVEIGNGCVEASGKTPGKSHKEVTADPKCQQKSVDRQEGQCNGTHR